MRGGAIVEILRSNGRQPRVHGNGFIQLDLTDRVRLHAWGDRRIPKQQVDVPLHDHVFSFDSHVLLGKLQDQLFDVHESETGPYRAHRAALRHGQDTILVPEGGRLDIVPGRTIVVRAGEMYHMPKGVVHQSTPLEASISIIVKDGPSLAQGGASPRVFVPVGTDVAIANDFDRDAAAPKDLLWQIIADIFDGREYR